MNITINTQISELQQLLVDELARVLLENSGRKVLFLYSGGSAMEVYSLLSRKLEQHNYRGEEVVFAPVDERYEEEYSNYLAFSRLVAFSQLQQMGVKFIETTVKGRSLIEMAEWYDGLMREWLEKVHQEKGLIISLLGLGADGHTAGIFPYPEDKEFFEQVFVKTERRVVGYEVGEKSEFAKRFTLTVSALSEIDMNFVYVVGDQKREALQKVLAEEGRLHMVPGRIWRELNEVSMYSSIA